jgi:hypothetical protein
LACVQNLLASMYLLGCLICAGGSAELQVLTLLGSPDIDADDEGSCVAWECTADVDFLSPAWAVEVAGIACSSQ